MPKAGIVTIDLDAGTGKFLLELNKASARVVEFGRNLEGAGTHGVSSMQAVSGSLRVLEGAGGIRAAERLLASFKGVAEVAKLAFPLAGTVALGEASVHVGEKVYEIYRKWDPIAQAEKRATDELKEYDKTIGSIRGKLAALAAESNVLAFGKVAGAALNASQGEAARKVQGDRALIAGLEGELARAQNQATQPKVRGSQGFVVQNRQQGAGAIDAEIITRQLDEAKKKLQDDEAAQQKLLTQSLEGQAQQTSTFSEERIDNQISTNATLAAIGRKNAELTIQINEQIAKGVIDRYTSTEARAVASAALEVQIAQQKLDKLGALDASEAKKHIQSLRDKSAAIPSTMDPTQAGKERLSIERQIGEVQGKSDEKQIELRGNVTLAQLNYKNAVVTAQREIDAMVTAGFERLDEGWKEAQNRVREYEDVRAKAEIKASETESAGAGEVAGIKALGQKLALERAYGMEVSHTNAQQIAHLSQIAALEENARKLNISGKRNELATAGDSDDPAQIEKAARLRVEIAKLQVESDNASFAAQTAIFDKALEQNHTLQATKEIADALTRWGQIDLGTFKKDLADAAAQIPQELASSLVGSIFDRQKRGQSKGQEVVGGLARTGEDVGKQLFTQVLTQAIERLIATLIPQAALASLQASAQTANTAAIVALTAAVSGNAAVTGVHAGIMTTHLGVMIVHLGVMIGNTVATVANTIATIAESIAAIFGFADGGRPAVGQPAIFGHGPELWIPDHPGTVIPANTTSSVMARLASSSGSGFPSMAPTGENGTETVTSVSATIIPDAGLPRRFTAQVTKYHLVEEKT